MRATLTDRDSPIGGVLATSVDRIAQSRPIVSPVGLFRPGGGGSIQFTPRRPQTDAIRCRTIGVGKLSDHDRPNNTPRTGASEATGRLERCRRLAGVSSLYLATASLWCLLSVPGSGDESTLHEPLDLFPPRFRVAADDTTVTLDDQDNVADPAARGGRCERFTVDFDRSPAWVILPIAPVQPVAELSATLAVRTLRPGVRVGFRVRLPHVRSPRGQTQTFYVAGDRTTRGGEFQRIGIDHFLPEMRQQIGVLRRRLGPHIDIADAHVDAVAVDLTAAGGGSIVAIDDVQIRGMVPIGAAGNEPPTGRTLAAGSESISPRLSVQEPPDRAAAMAFDPGAVTTMIEHRGEPLGYLRTLGFDTVWLSTPPTASLLTDAAVAGMRVVAPPPTMPDRSIEPLLGPVTGWIVDAARLDNAGRDAAMRQIAALRELPMRYRRPILGVVLENEAFYAEHLDVTFLNLPPAVRQIDPLAAALGRRSRVAAAGGLGRGAAAIGWTIWSGPPAAASVQAEAYSAAIGTPAPQAWRWQTMWQRCGEVIGTGATAILFRSGSSLTGGRAIDQSRATALRFVNRMIDSLSPLAAIADRSEWPRRVDEHTIAYRMRVEGEATGAGWVQILSTARRPVATADWPGSPPLAGDGTAMTLPIAANENVAAWRLTHLDAAPMPPGVSVGTAELLSADWVEWTLETTDRNAGGRLAARLRPHLAAAAADRLELAGAAAEQVAQSWRSALAMGLAGPNAAMPAAAMPAAAMPAAAMPAAAMPAPEILAPEVLAAAEQTIAAARQSLAAGRPAAAMRLAARADGWTTRAVTQLHRQMIAQSTPAGGVAGLAPRHRVSFPAVAMGDDETTLATWRLMEQLDGPAGDQPAPRWSVNGLSGGSLDLPQLVTEPGGGGWQFGRRPDGHTVENQIFVTAGWTGRGAALGGGAIAASVRPGPSGQPIGGGYAGTQLLVRSPPVKIDRDAPVAIEAMVRATGFADPHQGLLVHDSLGTQSLGVLVPGDGVWTHVRLLRFAAAGQDVEAFFEWIGGGEAVVDEVSIRSFVPPVLQADPSRLLRPITAPAPLARLAEPQ